MTEVDVAGLEHPSARAELMRESIDAIGTRAHQYLQYPADETWRDLVNALTGGLGDGQAYELLRAVQIHHRLSGRY